MLELLLKIVEQLNSSVFTLMLILIVFFVLVYKLGGIVKTFDGFKEKNKEAETNIGQIKEILSEIKATTKLLYDAHLKTVSNHSPVSLTSLGENIFKELNIKDKVEKLWSEIKKFIEEKSPINPYDIQTISMEIAKIVFERLFTEEDQNAVKTYAYNKGLNLLEIYPIIGIEIRDRYMSEKNIRYEEIDLSDPAKQKKR